MVLHKEIQAHNIVETFDKMNYNTAIVIIKKIYASQKKKRYNHPLR